MKKLSSLFLSLLMLFSLTACGNDEVTDAVIDAAAGALIDIVTDGAAPDISTDFSPSAPEDIGVIGGADTSTSIYTTDWAADLPVEGEYYYDLENVVLYLDTYGELPDNYITKDEARSLGWQGGTPERYLEGSAIGGDYFGNREGNLPDGDYTECDLNTLGKKERGAERLVFSDDGRYYHTEDHYDSFTQVWVVDGEVVYQ